ncbi:thermonuclease family protein [uncultured Desulfuromusa sp.]|uniref:thermonuclease family protein n=1 Tax=uncultured Desulfuromusa sp. TaxID=219183 RepID=UPI002AA6A08D|nr:thermonuclease family protein [uncultured Desulfuromusa sp.]
MFIFLFLLVTQSPAAEVTGKVLWVYDGDTLKVENIGKVRLVGIDSPESEASTRDHFYRKKFNIEAQQLRRVARQAKKYLMATVKGQTVRLVFANTEKDKYNRFLAYVYLADGDMLNRILLEKGLASVFRRYNFQYKKEFLKIEKTARDKGLGLWEKSVPQKFSLFNFWSQNNDGHPLLLTTTH